MEFKKLRENKVGKVMEKVISITKKKGRITENDIKQLKKKFEEDGRKQFNDFNVNLIKVESGGKWMTFTNEDKFNEYFSSKVNDPSKFYEFSNVHFYTMFE